MSDTAFHAFANTLSKRMTDPVGLKSEGVGAELAPLGQGLPDFLLFAFLVVVVSSDQVALPTWQRTQARQQAVHPGIIRAFHFTVKRRPNEQF